mmetsp:Transcript_230/g.460  ORF Transcript_230/g.460 Transcript_230/m.460 type:complete len:106 (-) Transcript_230:99-416(-)
MPIALQKVYHDVPVDALSEQVAPAQALADLIHVLDRVKALTGHPGFTLSNLNRCRSLISAFSMIAAHFHAEDGVRCKFLGDRSFDESRTANIGRHETNLERVQGS